MANGLNIDYPFRLEPSGRTATADPDGHIRDQVEQLLFTAPGERVNRPGFGTGLLQLLFLPNNEPLATATQAAVRGALSQWLGDLVAVEDVTVTADDAVLRVTVSYTVRRSQRQQVATFTRSVP